MPQGKAVGDTQESEPEIAHEGVQRQDIVVGVIGSVDTGLDSDVLNAFNKAGLKAPYVSTSMVDDPDAAAQHGVRSMVARKVSVIMIDGIAVNEKNAEDWDAALQSARKAGVPVILLDPVAPPDDDTLFAVTFTLAGRGDGRDRPRRRRRHHRRRQTPPPHDERHRQPVLTFRYPEALPRER